MMQIIFKNIICGDCGFSATFDLGLKRHKTLPHNLVGEKTFRCKDCAYPATKDHEKRSDCRVLRSKYRVTRNNNTTPKAPSWNMRHKIYKKIICEDCGFSATFNLALKRHNTLLHNLGKRNYSNVKIMSILQPKIMKRQYLHLHLTSNHLFV